MYYTRKLEVYKQPLYPSLTQAQLQRRTTFAFHFGSFMSTFQPKSGKPRKHPPQIPSFSSEFTNYGDCRRVCNFRQHNSSASAHGVDGDSPRWNASTSAPFSASWTSASNASTSSETLFAVPSASFPTSFASRIGAAPCSPPGDSLRLHYLSPSEGAVKCRSRIRADGLRFNNTGSRLLVALRESVLVVTASNIVTESVVNCPGAAIILPHNSRPDVFAVAGQEAYKQPPYVRLFDLRAPPASSSSSCSREISPVLEFSGPNTDAWWSGCWSPRNEDIVCIDRRDVLHVFSLRSAVRTPPSRSPVNLSEIQQVSGGRPPAAAAAAGTALSGAAANVSGRSSSSSGGVKRLTTESPFSFSGSSNSSVNSASSHAGVLDSSSNSGSAGTSARPKTPFTGTPGSGAGAGGAAGTRAGAGAGVSSSPSNPSRSSNSMLNTASPSYTPAHTSAASAAAPTKSRAAGSGEIRASCVFTQQLDRVVNACAFHQSGEWLLLAQDDGNLCILAYDASRPQQPFLSPSVCCTEKNSAAGAGCFVVPLQQQGGIACCAVDPHGRFLATGAAGSDRNVLLLEAESLEVVGEYGRAEGSVQTLAFSFDGQFIGWGCKDSTETPAFGGAVGSGGREGPGGSSYGGMRSSGALPDGIEERQETFLTIAGTDPCEIYLQCPTPAAVSSITFHPTRYICAFATEADAAAFAAAAQQQQSRATSGSCFWSKPQQQLLQQQHPLGILSFE